MSNSFTKLYSQLSDNSLKSSMMKMFNGAFSEIAKENILSKLSRDSFDKLTGNDKNAKIEETFSVAISFGKSLCEKTSQKTDKNARIAHIMKIDNNPNLINCFCIYLIDYIENNVNKNDSYVIAALTQDNAGVDDYVEIQEQINLIYGKKILRVIPVFDKIEKKPEPKIPNKFSDVYSNSETSQGVVCLKCGKENDEDSEFCCFCGSAIGGTVIPEKRQPQIPTPQPVYSSSQPKSENRCPRCNKVNRAISKFCLNCGAPLENVEKPEPIMDEGIELVSIDGEEKSSPAQEAYELNTDNWFDDNHAENRQKPQPATQNTVQNLFRLNEFLVDEKVSMFKFENSYKIYDMKGNIVGAAQQEKVSGGAKFARVAIGGKTKMLQKFGLRILDDSGKVLSVVNREGGNSTPILIYDGNGKLIAKTVKGILCNQNGNEICKMKSQFSLRNFSFIDSSGNPVIEIQHKWNGIKSLITTADKYYVKISENITGQERIAAFSFAAAIDLLLGDQ